MTLSGVSSFIHLFSHHSASQQLLIKDLLWDRTYVDTEATYA